LQGFGFLGIDAFDWCVHDELLVGAASEAAGVNCWNTVAFPLYQTACCYVQAGCLNSSLTTC
jgi:hypothetical protein